MLIPRRRNGPAPTALPTQTNNSHRRTDRQPANAITHGLERCAIYATASTRSSRQTHRQIATTSRCRASANSSQPSNRSAQSRATRALHRQQPPPSQPQPPLQPPCATANPTLKSAATTALTRSAAAASRLLSGIRCGNAAQACAVRAPGLPPLQLSQQPQ